MSISLLIASALLIEPVGQVKIDDAKIERDIVGYEELMAGQDREAIKHILASELDEKGDPAALINLGTAYARLGETEKARACFKAAMNSDKRSIVELADGSRMDSRRAARKANERLARNNALVMR